MEMEKHPRNPLVVQAQVLPALPNHEESALPEAYQPRLLHLSDKLVPGADLFITSRTVLDLASPAEPNVHPHRHDVSQTYVFTSPDDSLKVEVLLGDRTEIVQAPATVFIPAGLEHALRLLSGTGTVLSIVRSGVYE